MNEAVQANFSSAHKTSRRYAGKHLLVDCWGCRALDDLKLMEATLKQCIVACEASLLHLHLHQFVDNHGISGVAVLAESHLSVHTWPETGFAAFDIFMCGRANPERATPILRQAFSPFKIQMECYLRGSSPPQSSSV